MRLDTTIEAMIIQDKIRAYKLISDTIVQDKTI